MGLVSYLRRPDVRRDLVRLLLRRVLLKKSKDYRIRFDGDLWMRLRPTDAVSRAIYLYGYAEYRMATTFSRLVTEGMTVLDAGAHIGQYSLLAAKRVGPRGSVIAVEPNPSNARRLRENLDLNHFTNTTVLEVALSDQPGSVTLYIADDLDHSPLGSLIPQTGRALRVDARTIDNLGLKRLDVLKLDVEGVEERVLMGGEETLSRCKPPDLF